MPQILVTGGCGYIGTHTIVDLVNNGFDVVCVDNNMRSGTELLKKAEAITGKKIPFFHADLCDYETTAAIFRAHPIDGIIHFAALKSVNESVEDPLLYFRNNLSSQANILKCATEFGVNYFVFSSSCSVYGNTSELPVSETTVLQKAESPYGRTKQLGEEIILEMSKKSNIRFALLRYFNPAGAHPSAEIGEVPFGRPSNLVPGITQFAIGKLPFLKVFGTDYDTRDGSCIRDIVHVCDIAHAHTLALQHLNRLPGEAYCEIFNLGTGNGVTVLEVINAFEKVTGMKLDYERAARREGDVVSVYASNKKAREVLKWEPQYGLEQIMATAWNWEKKIHADHSAKHQ